MTPKQKKDAAKHLLYAAIHYERLADGLICDSVQDRESDPSGISGRLTRAEYAANNAKASKHRADAREARDLVAALGFVA